MSSSTTQMSGHGLRRTRTRTITVTKQIQIQDTASAASTSGSTRGSSRQIGSSGPPCRDCGCDYTNGCQCDDCQTCPSRSSIATSRRPSYAVGSSVAVSGRRPSYAGGSSVAISRRPSYAGGSSSAAPSSSYAPSRRGGSNRPEHAENCDHGSSRRPSYTGGSSSVATSRRPSYAGFSTSTIVPESSYGGQSGLPSRAPRASRGGPPVSMMSRNPSLAGYPSGSYGGSRRSSANAQSVYPSGAQSGYQSRR